MKKGLDYIGVGVGSIIINREKKTFLARRGEKAQNEKGKWSYPGGGLKFGETFEACIRREMKEEFDIEIEPIEQLGTFNHMIPKDKQHWVAVAYICKLMEGTPKILESEKEEEMGWFTIEETEKLPLTLVAKHRLKQLKEKYPKGLPNFYTRSI